MGPGIGIASAIHALVKILKALIAGTVIIEDNHKMFGDGGGGEALAR
jgi:hypothetical protein